MIIINSVELYDNVEVRFKHRGSAATWDKVDRLYQLGYYFLPGNNKNLRLTKKWSNCDAVLVAITNPAKRGSTKTLWALRPLAKNA